MREVKYRARALESDYFIYGLPYIDHLDDEFFITHSNGWTPTYSDPDSGEVTVKTACDIETLQEYTGLKDKNGVEIYEGDIISYWNGSLIISSPNEKGSKFYKSLDRWMKPSKNKLAQIMYVPPSFRITNGNPLGSQYLGESEIEIIGNIHENPELLQEQE